jgi:hypothetical protein
MLLSNHSPLYRKLFAVVPVLAMGMPKASYWDVSVTVPDVFVRNRTLPCPS